MYTRQDTVSRFFTFDDEKQTKYICELPVMWWSRFYEYKFACKFINKNDILLDSCSGIAHPFKFYLTDLCKKVYACDINSRITNKEEIIKDVKLSLNYDIDEKYVDKINYTCCDIANTPYKNNYFNVITCISVLEHLDNNKQKETLKEYYRILKKNGLVILTIDYPNADPKEIIEYANKIGFKLLGDINFNMSDNILKCDYWDHTLYCFRIVLIK